MFFILLQKVFAQKSSEKIYIYIYIYISKRDIRLSTVGILQLILELCKKNFLEIWMQTIYVSGEQMSYLATL